MTRTTQNSDRKTPTLDRLTDLVAGSCARPELAKAGKKMHRLVDFYDPPVGYIGRLQTIRSISDLAIGDAKFTNFCRPLAAWSPYIDAVLAAPKKFADDLGLADP